MREALELGRLHMLITFGAEIIHEQDLKMIRVNNTEFQAGIVMGRRHPLARKKKVTIEDIQYEPIAVLSGRLSNDHRGRVQSWFWRHGINHSLDLKEFDSFYNLQIALATGKCVSVMYERIMDGMEDKLSFYLLDDADVDGAEVVIAWKKEKYAVKAKNIANLFGQKTL